MPQSDSEEDFTSHIGAIDGGNDSQADKGTHGDSSDSGSDLEQMQRALHVPGPTADVQELRKALSFVQEAYFEMRNELRSVRRDYVALQATVPARSRNHTTKAPSELDKSIAKAAKKYMMFYNFWIDDSIFPTIRKPNIDPRSPMRWSSPQAMADGTVEELYEAVPKELHKQMETYQAFKTVFRHHVNTEHSNLLKAVKDSASIVFSSLKLPVDIFSESLQDSKATSKDLLILLKLPENVELNDKYERLAPVLFTDPHNMTSDMIFKSVVLVKMARLLLKGKSSLLGTKKRGGPKPRGEIMKVNSITEGMIASFTVMARYLLTHDTELNVEGNHTKIRYHDDFNFYVRLLFKHNKWSREVMQFFNDDLFGPQPPHQPLQFEPTHLAPQPHNWEDDTKARQKQHLTNQRPSR
ncbi:hypothetical protein F5J12DRAFT_896047 [Pisolithus orientalis]|uniref:uncharacterized protein n=1 Tax=Pisolithus orientalis TaxID=936130 RepID=UPI002223F91F|nr:uncharacterized protein F5J12DRAFT_896047 [Pisolithus orientalis]KAI5996911.1 hypothetical protein F5J12DRAFT_896047 [Pisolithus orientalis]